MRSLQELGRLVDKQAKLSTNDGEDLLAQTVALRRQVALSNPLLDFDSVIFRRYSYRPEPEVVAWGNNGGHIQDGQGIQFDTTGGIYILSGLRSSTHSVSNLLQNSRFENGPYQGRLIRELGGAFGMMTLDYDGKRLVFAWTPRKSRLNPAAGSITGWKDYTDKVYNDSTSFHIFTVNVNGSNLRQLTFGRHGAGHVVLLRRQSRNWQRNMQEKCLWQSLMLMRTPIQRSSSRFSAFPQ